MSVLREYAGTVTQQPLPFAAQGGLDGALALEGATRFDEVIADDGTLRTAWRGLADRALALTPAELQRVDQEIRRFLADDGVTYNRADVGAEPWQLDPMPLVIDAPTWSRLEVGLAQRAELLNAILTDLYGPQELLASGTLPAATIFAHAGFARPLARRSAADARPLILSATDLGRDQQGEWRVLADRVQAPSGLGFAMENRRVISQVLPDLYQESDLHRVEPYFAALRTSLIDSAPEGVSEPRVVVLSPGPHSETAYDQAFLAGALGFPLVQGSDLIVRDGYVWMKPARWPARVPTERIDVILRRVDAEWCDPLELRGGSQLGVAGLAEAVRRGRVRLVNGLGAGVLENPALMPFLPAISERLLGEQLRLSSVPTWWCGDEESRESVLTRIAEDDPSLLVRVIDEPRASIAGLDRDGLAARIRSAPHRFVGQDLLPLSQAPVWGQNHAEARPLVLRAFTLRYGSAYRPLVGGLATVRAGVGAAPTSKDVWVLKAAQTDLDQGLTEVAPLTVAPTVPTFAPRALEDLFWAGRYAERAEDIVRLLLTTQALVDQMSGPAARHGSDAASRALLDALEHLAGSEHDDPDTEFRALLLDARRRGSAAYVIQRLRDALEGVRDQLSGDTWRVFAGIARADRALRQSERPHRTAESGSRVLTCLLSLHGITANMMRDDSWRMIEAGRYLERALQVCHLLTATVTERRSYREDRDVFESMLTAAESVVTYRRRYRGSVRIVDALELLLLAPDNPRSVAFSLAELRRHLAEVRVSTGSTRPERLLDSLTSAIEGIDVAELTRGTTGRREALAGFLADLTRQLEQLADAIAQQHFASGPPPLALDSLALIEEIGALA